MDFKLDENLPAEACRILRDAGHDAVSVLDQELGGSPDTEIARVCKSEGRAIVTLDTDFANIIAYPPGEYAGIIVIRSTDQSKAALLELIRQLTGVFGSTSPDKRLWIVEKDRIRVRESA